MTLEHLYNEAQKLSACDRERLVELLELEIARDQNLSDDLTTAERADLERRITAWRADPTRGESLGSIGAEIERRLADVRRHRDGAGQARPA